MSVPCTPRRHARPPSIVCDAALLLQIGGSGVLVQPMTYIFDEEPLRWQRLLENLGRWYRWCSVVPLVPCGTGILCMIPPGSGHNGCKRWQQSRFSLSSLLNAVSVVGGQALLLPRMILLKFLLQRQEMQHALVFWGVCDYFNHCAALCCAVLCAVCPAGIQDVDSKEPEAVAAYMASNGAATAAAAGARR